MKRSSKSRPSAASLPPDVDTVDPKTSEELSKFLRELTKCSNDKLKYIISDDDGSDYIDRKIKMFSKLKELEKLRSSIHEENTISSQIILAREPKFVRDRQKLSEEIESIRPQMKTLEIKCKQVIELTNSIGESYERLSKAAVETEEQSEEISNSFLQGKITYDDFLGEYLEKRKLVHVRRAKADRLRASIPKLPDINFGIVRDQDDDSDFKDTSL